MATGEIGCCREMIAEKRVLSITGEIGEFRLFVHTTSSNDNNNSLIILYVCNRVFLNLKQLPTVDYRTGIIIIIIIIIARG